MNALEHSATPVPTWKGFIQYVYKLNTTIKIIALPQGRDPDELIRESGAEWERLVKEAIPVQDFFLELVRKKYDLTTAGGKAAAVEEAMGAIGAIPDPVQQAHYVQRLATLVGIPEAILLQQVRRPSRRSSRSDSAPPLVSRAQPVFDVEAYCVALALREPSLVEQEPKVSAEDFRNPAYREIFRKVVECRTFDRDEVVDRVRESLAEPLRDSLTQLLELQTQHPVHFQEHLESAYKSAAVNLLLRSLSLRMQELEAMRFEGEPEVDLTETTDLARIEQEIAKEIQRLYMLKGTLPLRAIHKEVRHGG